MGVEPEDREVEPEGPALEWSETEEGEEARETWARWYDGLNGAPEGEWDR